MRKLRLLAAGVLALAIYGSAAIAQPAFPNREITFIVPWGAGGGNDVVARTLQPLLKERGFNIVVENIAGGTGAIGLRRVASSPADGYVIGMGTSSTLALMAQNKTPLKVDMFTHIAHISTDPLMLLVRTDGPYRSLDDFLAHMRRNPGKVSIGTPGTYNILHLFAAMTARAAGADYVNVPYTAGSKLVADLLGGHLDAAVLKPSDTMGQTKDKLLQPIAIFGTERLAIFPDVPTFKEKGFDIFPFGPLVQMTYIVAPPNLSDDIRAKLIEAFRAAMQDPRFKEFADKNGFLVEDLSGDALTTEVEKVAAAIGKAGAQVFPKDQN